VSGGLLASVLDSARASDSLLVGAAVMAAGALIGYAIGAINPASIIARVRGTDLRSIGSGNPGATNAGRAFGWKVGVLVGLLDVLKGFVPVQLLQWLGFHDGALVAGLAAVVGHITSPYLRGRGGKGVATSFGAVLGVQPLWALPVLAVFGIAFAITRRIGLASVAGCLALVPTALLLRSPLPDVLFAAALTLLVVVRHRRNLQAALGR
jgi:glycerol-3-phosphate acyltransferase PlsY